MRRRLPAAICILCAALAATARAEGIDDAVAGTYWGEAPETLQRHLGTRGVALPHPLDFGDSYAPLVMRGVTIGGYPLIAYYQIDKVTHGLKRIQLERNRHGVNPPAFRAILAALDSELGPPSALCGTRAGPASGYQAASERVWQRDGIVIRAIFRDTTIEAFEGCLAGDPSLGPCGLTGQLLVRVSPPSLDPGYCPAPAHAR